MNRNTDKHPYTDKKILEWMRVKELATRRYIRELREQVRCARNIIRSDMTLDGTERQTVAGQMKAALDSTWDFDRSALFFYKKANPPTECAGTHGEENPS